MFHNGQSESIQGKKLYIEKIDDQKISKRQSNGIFQKTIMEDIEIDELLLQELGDLVDENGKIEDYEYA